MDLTLNLPVRESLVEHTRAARRQLRDRFLSRPRDPITVREDIARTYLRGSGIEVGALNVPLRVPQWVHIRYVDYLPIETLREHHAHLLAHGQELAAPDVVDDGERLESFADESLDFVIANHFIEHSEDPIGTLAAHMRVLRPGGVLFYAVPDKRWTFDVDREVTPLDHVIRDHEEGPAWSRHQHYLEWARFVDQVADADAERHAAEVAARRFSIHFHVWTPTAYLELLIHCQSSGLPFELELFQRNKGEFITILRKRSDELSHEGPRVAEEL